LAAVCAVLGRMPTPEEYLDTVGDKLTKNAGEIYRYLNFDKMANYKPKKTIPIIEAAISL